MSNYRFRKLSDDPEIRRMQLEIQDNFVKKDKDGNIIVDGTIQATNPSASTKQSTASTGGVVVVGDNPTSAEFDAHLEDTSTHGVDEIADKTESESYAIAMSVAMGMP